MHYAFFILRLRFQCAKLQFEIWWEEFLQNNPNKYNLD